MNLPEFSYLAPTSLQEASAMLAEHGEAARVLAGGTDILVKMKQRRLLPRVLINLKRIPGLDYVGYQPGRGLTIGPLATLEAVNADPAVRARYPILHDAVSSMGTIEVRNSGTIAGNLCNASPAAETLPPLMLLGAHVQTLGPEGQRDIPVAAFVTGPGTTALAPGELLTEIAIPEPVSAYGGAYDKFCLRRMDLAVAGAAAMLAFDGEAMRDVQIVLSALAPKALRATSAETLLEGRKPDEQLLHAAGVSAAGDCDPRPDFIGGVDYKRRSAALLATRVLRRAIERARREQTP